VKVSQLVAIHKLLSPDDYEKFLIKRVQHSTPSIERLQHRKHIFKAKLQRKIKKNYWGL
jgi:hypothetical protein